MRCFAAQARATCRAHACWRQQIRDRTPPEHWENICAPHADDEGELNMAKNRVLFQLKVTLRDIQPAIWRRILVWEDTTLAQLHTILQIVMSWEDYHLHDFVIGRRRYSVPDPDDDMYERKVID